MFEGCICEGGEVNCSDLKNLYTVTQKKKIKQLGESLTKGKTLPRM